MDSISYEESVDFVKEMTDIYFAVLRNDIAKARTLLENGADPNKVKEAVGFTLMHAAAKSLATNGHNPAMIHLLLEYNTDINERDFSGITPLVKAIGEGGVEATRIFVNAGADVNLHNSNGWSALHEAIKLQDAASVEVLLEAGADALIPRYLGLNVINFAESHGTVEVLRAFDRFREMLRPAFEMFDPGLHRKALEESREELELPAITDEWWTLWVNLVTDRCGPEQDRVVAGHDSKNDGDAEGDRNDHDARGDRNEDNTGADGNENDVEGHKNDDAERNGNEHDAEGDRKKEDDAGDIMKEEVDDVGDMKEEVDNAGDMNDETTQGDGKDENSQDDGNDQDAEGNGNDHNAEGDENDSKTQDDEIDNDAESDEDDSYVMI